MFAEDGPLVLTEEPTCNDVAMAEERAAGRLKSLLKQWDTSRPGASLLSLTLRAEHAEFHYCSRVSKKLVSVSSILFTLQRYHTTPADLLP